MLALFVICFVALFQLQETSVHDKVSFILSTREIKNYRIQANNMTYLSTFNPGMLLKVIIHGENDTIEDKWAQEARDRYQAKGGLNVILVDWSVISSEKRDIKIPRRMVDVAETVTDMIKEWHSYCIHSFNDVHIVGFSEGAHIAAIVGYKIKKNSKIPIGRITGLDPDRWSFHMPPHTLRPEHKLDRSDATFVDIIHTDCEFRSEYEMFCQSMGHIDFMPQGGYQPQPACVLRLPNDIEHSRHCSHRLSRDYFVESINSLAFQATQCLNDEDFDNKYCDHNDVAIMGENVDMSQRGRFYLYVGSKSPYGLYKFRP